MSRSATRLRWYGEGEGEWWARIVTSDKTQTTVETPNNLQFCIKPSRHGKGCFAVADLKPHTFLGVYPGSILNEKQFTTKMSKLPFDKQKNVMRYVVQNKLHSTLENKCYLDPTNAHGSLDSGWKSNPVLYINEPDDDQKTNVMSVWNYDTVRLEIWTSLEIKTGSELLVHYGDSYSRSYQSPNKTNSGCTWIFKNGKLFTEGNRI